MEFKYLPGVEPGGKIDLNTFNNFEGKSKFPRPETYLPRLQSELGALSERLTSAYGDFFTADGQMKMTGVEADVDTELMAENVRGWSADEGKTPEQWLASREKNPSNITEVATTLLFDKILGADFIIVRASTYDDYQNGADQLIIDKQTGAVICGLDDVIGNVGDDGGAKKAKKIKQKMDNGGAKIKYGATFEDGQLVRKKLSNIPLFYFSLSKTELDNLLKSLTGDQAGADSGQVEKDIYAKLVDSLNQQSALYAADKSLNPLLQANLERFAPSLAKLAAYSKLG